VHRTIESHSHTHATPIRWRYVVAVATLAWLATGWYSVQPGEEAVVRRFGRALDSVRKSGLHFGMPIGIDSVSRVRTLEHKRVGVGMALADRDLARRADGARAECVTGDRNLILISAVVQYRVVDAKAYLFATSDPAAVVRGTAAGVLSEVVSSMQVDDVLTVERLAIQRAVIAATQSALDRYGVGVWITSVSLEGVAPPQEVAEAFHDVTSAREDRQRAVNEAQGYANRLVPRARGEAQRILLEAAAYATQTTEGARGEADRFTKLAAELAVGRELTEGRLILEAQETVMPRLEKIVLEGDAAQDVDLGIIEADR